MRALDHFMLCEAVSRARREAIKRFAAMSDEEIAAADIDELDFAAFGIKGGVQELLISALTVRFKADIDLARDQVVDPRDWIEHLRSSPIEVRYEKGKLVIHDGHHRYVAARMLKRKKILANVEVRDNPVIAIKRGVR